MAKYKWREWGYNTVEDTKMAAHISFLCDQRSPDGTACSTVHEAGGADHATGLAYSEVGREASHIEDHITWVQAQQVLQQVSLLGADHGRFGLSGRVGLGVGHLCVLVNPKRWNTRCKRLGNNHKQRSCDRIQ